MKKYIIILFLLLGVFSCKGKKEPMDALDGDKAIFVGKWNWFYTRHSYNTCTGDPEIVEIITPDTEESNYSTSFFKEGMVKYYENENEIGSYRLIFDGFENDGCFGKKDASYFRFQFSLNGDKSNDKIFQGCVRPDTLYVIRGFPFMKYDEGCETYTSYFVKE